MKKRIISIVLALVLVLTTTMFAAPTEKTQADSNYSVFSSKMDLADKETSDLKIKIPTEEYMEYYNSLSKAEKTEMNQRSKDALKNYLDMLSNSKQSYRSHGCWNLNYCTLPESFMVFQQDTPTWCGLACLQSILMYINGYSYTQGTLASFMGVPVDNHVTNLQMINCLNDYQNTQQYYDHIPVGLDGMVSLIYEAIAINRVPACLRISTDGGKYWRYNCPDGHYLISHWIAPSTERIGIADPYAGYAGIPRYYEERYDTVYNVILDVIA